MRYKIWNKTDDLYTPSGEKFTAAEVLAKQPLASIAKMIICDMPINMGVFMEFVQTKEIYKKAGATITDTMTDQEALDAISYYEENPAITEPTPEERSAAALEFQAMMLI